MAVPHLCHSSHRLSYPHPLGTIETMRPFARTEAPAGRGQAGPRSGSAYRSAFRRFPSTGHHEFRATYRRREFCNQGRRRSGGRRRPHDGASSDPSCSAASKRCGRHLPAAAPTDGRSRVPDRAAVISACLNEYRCGAATQRYRSALPELRLRSLHRSSAFRGDRQRGPMRYPDVRPNSSIRQNTDLSP